MDKDDLKKILMQGDDRKHDQKKSPPPYSPPTEPRREREDYDDHTRKHPTPLTESEPPPDTVEPEEGWERE